MLVVETECDHPVQSRGSTAIMILCPSDGMHYTHGIRYTQTQSSRAVGTTPGEGAGQLLSTDASEKGDRPPNEQQQRNSSASK